MIVDGGNEVIIRAEGQLLLWDWICQQLRAQLQEQRQTNRELHFFSVV
jgi:hypothetical protein